MEPGDESSRLLSIRTSRHREKKSTHLHRQGECARWVISLWISNTGFLVPVHFLFPFLQPIRKVLVRLMAVADLHWFLIVPRMSSLILTSNPVECVLGFTSIFPVTHEDMDIAIAISDNVLRIRLLVTTNNRDPKIETRKWRA